MKFNIVIFSYKDDYSCLKTNLRQLLKTANNSNVYIINDYFNPLDENQILELKKINPDIIVKTTYFDRSCGFFKRSLNGLENLRGMITVYQEIAATNDYPFIKLDSDTLLISTKYFEEQINKGKTAIGFMSYKSFAFSGTCYCFNKNALNDITDYLVKEYIFVENGDHVPEDVYFSRIFAMTQGKLFNLKRAEEGSSKPEKLYSAAIHEIQDDKLTLYLDLIKQSSNLCCIHCGQTNVTLNRDECNMIMEYFFENI